MPYSKKIKFSLEEFYLNKGRSFAYGLDKETKLKNERVSFLILYIY